jgi:hypothetical protein
MKKIFLIILIMATTKVLFADEVVTLKKKKTKKKTTQTTVTDAKAKAGILPPEIKKDSVAPCDTKEDLLKKLEEEKKKQKPFALQGGNTGCSADK